MTRFCRLPAYCDVTGINGLVWKPVLNSEGVRSVRKCRHLFDCLRWNCWTSFLVGVSDFFSYLFYKALYICIGGIWYYDRYRKKDMLNFGQRILPHFEYGSGRTLGWGWKTEGRDGALVKKRPIITKLISITNYMACFYWEEFIIYVSRRITHFYCTSIFIMHW